METFLLLCFLSAVVTSALFSVNVTFLTRFFNTCSSQTRRSPLRIRTELIVHFILPILACCFLYANLGYRLLQHERRAKRNRVLTLAFFLSWLLWVVCWLPNYTLTSMQIADKYSLTDSNPKWRS